MGTISFYLPGTLHSQHSQSSRLRPILMRVVRLIPPIDLADASFSCRGGERRNGLYSIAEVYYIQNLPIVALLIFILVTAVVYFLLISEIIQLDTYFSPIHPHCYNIVLIYSLYSIYKGVLSLIALNFSYKEHKICEYLVLLFPCNNINQT